MICCQECPADEVQEAHEGRLDLSEENLDAVTRIITFMYGSGERAPRGDAIEVATVFQLARRFGMDDFSVLLYHELDIVVTWMWAKDSDSFAVKDLVPTVQIIYQTIPLEETRSMRKLLADCIALQADFLIEKHPGILEQAFATSGSFALDVFRAGKGQEIV